MESWPVNGKQTPIPTNGHATGREGQLPKHFQREHRPEVVNRYVKGVKFWAQKSALPLTDRLQTVMARARFLEKSEQYKAAQELQFWATTKMASFALDLDTYDDIFNDFEIKQSYSQRELSEDFLKLLRMYHREKPKGGFEIYLMIPASERDEAQEGIIRQRLREHFEEKVVEVKGQLHLEYMEGRRLTVAGLAVVALESLVGYLFSGSPVTFGSLFLVEGLSIPAWFLMWKGLDTLTDTRKDLKPALDFNEKFIDCRYVFIPIDDS